MESTAVVSETLAAHPGLVDGLKRRYAEPHRHYHTWDHIQYMERLFTPTKRNLHDPEAVALAIYYHDAIYDPARSDNERQSASLIETELSPIVDKKRLAGPVVLVNATEQHSLPPGLESALETDCRYFLDMDLAILGSPWSAYVSYAKNIRREYSQYGDFLYKTGRRKILKKFLASDSLFFTPYFADLFEHQARDNLQRELEDLL